MFEFLADFTGGHQTLLWLMTISLDLSFALLLYRLFGKTGLYASIILSILMANLQGPKLTIIWLLSWFSVKWTFPSCKLVT